MIVSAISSTTEPNPFWITSSVIGSISLLISVSLAIRTPSARPQHLARRGVGETAALEGGLAVDEDVGDALGELVGSFERAALGVAVGVEDDEVRPGTRPDAAA